MWRVTFHGHVELNLMTTAATFIQIDIYNFVYKFDSICSIHIMLVTILRY